MLNYIRDGGFWYFVDLTHYRLDFLRKAGVETGLAGDYLASDFVAGNLHRAASPLDYVRYCLGAFTDPPDLFFLYTAEDCLPAAAGEIAGTTVIYYPQGRNVTVLYDPPDDRLETAFVPAPEAVPDWSIYPSAF